MSQPPGVLAGTRVLDFGRFIAGPYCGALLADLGAEVIRIERVGGGEDRDFVPVAADGSGAAFLQCNRGKRGLALNTAHPGAGDVIGRLVRSADVVITNLPERSLVSMGLDYARLRAIRADIIALNLSAFGSGGEWSERVGFDGLMQAMSGTAHFAGPAGHPTRVFASYVDFSAATIGAMSVLAALLHRFRTGEGQRIEGSLYRTAVTWNSTALIEESVLGLDRQSTHNRGQTAGPSDIFRTRDGWVMCLVVGPYQFRKWAAMVGEPGLEHDARFRSDTDRGAHGEVLSEIMGRWCRLRTTLECSEAMNAHGLPGGPVLSARETLESPHLRQTGIFEDVPSPGGGAPVPLATFPATLFGTPAAITGAAPKVGEHTAIILAALGYGPEEIDALRAERVVQ